MKNIMRMQLKVFGKASFKKSVMLMALVGFLFCGNQVDACRVIGENNLFSMADSINPADSVYYEPVVSNGTLGTFLVATDEMESDTTVVEHSGTKVYDVIESQPQFPGGLNGLIAWLSYTVEYPSEAYKNKKEGKVLVQFVIDIDGSVTDARVVKGVDALLDAEALRVVNLMPTWIPAKQNGEPVKVRFTLPISFKI